MTEYILLDDFIPDEVISSAEAQGYLRELVRCKNCKYLTEKDMSENCDWHEYVCLKRDEWLYDLNWFCADGELKE